MEKRKRKRKKEQRQNNPKNFPLFEPTLEASKEAEETETRNEKEKSSLEPMTPMSQFYNLLFKDKSGAWTAIFTCVLAVFSYLLWSVSRDANNTSTATQAASVSSFGPGVTKVTSDDGKTLKGYNIIMGWSNNGTTPIRTLVMQSNVTVGRDIPTKSLDFNSLQQSKSVTAVLGPKAGIQTNPNYVRLQDLEDVAQNKTHMFYWGWAVYKDVFSDTPRLAEYCFDVEGVSWTKPNHEDPTGELNLINPPCGVHFCFNEECEDYKSRTK